jgi:hypothetical protein
MAVLDDFAIDYTNKRIYHNTGTTVWSMNALYSALQDTFDELGQMDDDIPMSAQTPTEYRLENAWFMGDEDLHYLDGGALSTAGWGSNEIVKVDYTESVALVASDKGKPITTASYDGVLLDYNDVTLELWIRPDVPASDLFDSAEAFTITGGTGTGSVVVSTNVSGNNLWANPYIVTPVNTDTQCYIYQLDNEVLGVDGTKWWPEGPFDILLKVTDMGVDIDRGFITAFAHRPGTLTDHFIIDLSAGGRQPIPLSPSSDLNNRNGYRTISVDGTGVVNLVVGEIVNGVTSGAKGEITAVTGTPATQIEYFLLGDLTTDFQSGEQLDGETSGTNGGDTDSAPSDVNAAVDTYGAGGVSFAYASGVDIGDGAGNYAITIDLQDASIDTLAKAYEKTKYDFRRGETTTTFNGIEGEAYVGISVKLAYTPGTDPAVGEKLTGGTSGATGYVAAVNAAGDEAWLHNVVGTFSDTETVTGDGSGNLTNVTVSSLNVSKVNAFMTFAGGTMFGAPGVQFINIPSGYANSYFQTDLDGVSHSEPAQITLTVNSMVAGDRVMLTEVDANDNIIENQGQVNGTTAGGDNSFSIDGVAADDFYDRNSTSGVIVVQQTDGTDHVFRYSSLTQPTSTTASVTLATGVSGAATGGDSTTLNYSTGGFTAGVRVGDLVWNSTESVFATVISVDSDTQLTTTAVTDWNGDSFETNALGGDYDGLNVYVPWLMQEATATSHSTSIIYSVDRDITVRVRKKGIIPFKVDTSFSSANFTQSAIRTDDNIVTI